jgi:hypothetical protein
MQKPSRKILLKGVPYSKAQLKAMSIAKLWQLAATLGATTRKDGKYGSKDTVIDVILEAQKRHDERIEDFCEMCGNYVFIRQKAHIAAEGGAARANILQLCPNCHLMFDTRLKPRLYQALKRIGVKNLPASWQESIYLQPSTNARMKKK